MTIRNLSLKFAGVIIATLVCSGLGAAQAHGHRQKIYAAPSTTKKSKTPEVIQPKWKVFTAPDRGFTVLMPGMPKTENQTQKTFMGPINLQMFVAQPPKQQVAYVVAYNDFPYNYAQMTKPEEILDNAQSMALKTTQSHLVLLRNIRSSNGHPGREIEYVNSGGKITKERMYVAEGRLYQVMAVVSKKQEKSLSKTIVGYLNSFNLVLKRG